jgi:acetyl esterase
VRISPLLNPDLKGLPPAHVLTCGWDPLKDEGRAYADRLAAAGVAVTSRHYPDEVHGFLSLTAVSRTAREVLIETGRIVAGALV